MSQSLTIPNFGSANLKEPTKLDLDAPIGSTSLTVAYGDNIAATDYILIGQPGSESGEVRIVNTGPTTTALPITVATGKLHNRFDPINKLFGNQIKIYTAANVDGTQPLDTSFTSYGSPIAIDYDQSQTLYTDAAGDSTKWYKFTYLNSTTNAETVLADSTAVRGGNIGNYTSIEAIRAEAGLTNARFITDAMIDAKRQTAQALINATLAGSYVIPFVAPINPLIADITKVLAAGYLLVDNYGPTSTLNTNQGMQKIESIIGKDGNGGMLGKINSGNITLTGVTGIASNLSSPGIFNGWPDASTASMGTTGTDPETFAFRRSDRY